MSLIQTLYAPIIGFDNRSLVNVVPLTIKWLGTSSPAMAAVSTSILPTYTASWSGTSSPLITVTT